jgi:3-hydroxybutyryl-CoA dehydrogenase
MEQVMLFGAGTMGAGIAQVIAQSKRTVFLVDVSTDLIQQAKEKIQKALDRLVQKGQMTSTEKTEILDRIISVDDPVTVSPFVDLFLEAITENLQSKRVLWQAIGKLPKKPDAILATNTSALSITELAQHSASPARFLGLHFFNPVPLMSLVEIVCGASTDEAIVGRVRQLIESLGKTPIIVRESPGFVVNRVLVPMINEAVYVLMEGVAKAEDIDKGLKLGANHPIGPLALADLIGLDVCLSVMETLHNEFGDSKYRPCPLLKTMVRAGFLGRKTGRGFFSYAN